MNRLKSLSSLLKEKPQLVLIIFGVAFFFLYSWLYSSTPALYNSPDETATAVFTQQYLEVSQFGIPFTPNPSNTIHPRSVNISGANFVPGGFIGLPLLLALVAKVVGQWVIIFLPALFAVLAVFASYVIFSRIFSKNIALLSSLSFFFLPQWWHFSSKGFLPNSIFISFLLIGVACFLFAHNKEKVSKYYALFCSFFSGLAISLALIIRPNELWWVSGAFVFLLFSYRKQVRFKQFLLAITGAVLPILVFLSVQSQTYGGAFVTGYDQLQASEAPSLSLRIISSLFPFGIDLIQTVQTLFLFVFQLFWWQSILLALGLIAYYKNPLKSNEQKKYTIVFLAISLYLFLYYGAWVIADDLDLSRVSIGISYIRYWLPFFILSLPFCILGLQYLVAKTKYQKRLFSLLFILLLVGQVIFVYQGKDGLQQIQQTVVNYKEIQEQLLSVTEDDAVIVGERIDKIVWPLRQVIHFENQDFTFVEHIPEVMDSYSIYWLTLLPYDHMLIWEQTVFAPIGLQLKPVQFNSHGYSLYQIEYAK